MSEDATKDPTTENLEKLEKFFRLLSSDQEGEAMAALRMSKKLIAAFGKNWNEFVDGLANMDFGLLVVGAQQKRRSGGQTRTDAYDAYDDFGDIFGGMEGAAARAHRREARAARHKDAQDTFEKEMAKQAEDILKSEAETIFKATGMYPEEWEVRLDTGSCGSPELDKLAEAAKVLDRAKDNSSRFFKGAVFESGKSASEIVKEMLGEDKDEF